VTWYDIASLPLNYDVTQINWTYNGTIVQSGNAVGYWWWFTLTHWNLGPYDVTQLLGPGSSYLRGETVAVFWNNWFCPGPTVYIDIYYNRVWGHANGTATRAQSSASINECAPLHVGINSAYGQF
jgi:hypothetical protein